MSFILDLVDTINGTNSEYFQNFSKASIKDDEKPRKTMKFTSHRLLDKINFVLEI